MKKILALASLALLLAACTPKTTTPTETTVPNRTMAPVASATVRPSPTVQESTSGAMMQDGTFKLTAQNNSKQDGTATLEEVGGRVKVTLALGAATTSAEPAHIHLGSCPTPGEVKYPLTNVVSGKSVTTLPAGVTMASLKELGKISINVHKSATDLKTYMSCGNLDFPAVTSKASASASAKASASVKPSASPAAMTQ
jgi:Cu/Zn superoxide dismutase